MLTELDPIACGLMLLKERHSDPCFLVLSPTEPTGRTGQVGGQEMSSTVCKQIFLLWSDGLSFLCLP